MPTRQTNHSTFFLPGAVTCLRARLVGLSGVVPASEVVSMGRRCLGMEKPLAAICPCCGATDSNTHHARVMPPSRRAKRASITRCSTRCPAPSSGWPSAAKRKAKRPLTPTGTSAWELSSRGKASGKLRHQSTATQRYSRTSRMHIHNKRCFTFGLAWLIEMDQRLPLPRRESATPTRVCDRCPLTNVAINVSPLRRKALDPSERKGVKSSTGWRQSVVGGMGRVVLHQEKVCVTQNRRFFIVLLQYFAWYS